MHASQPIRNNHPAPAAPGVAPMSLRHLRVTFTTNGAWFSAHGDIKDDAGFELHFSTDGNSAELTINTEEARTPLPTLRLYHDRPA